MFCWRAEAVWHPSCETTWQNTSCFSKELRSDFDKKHTQLSNTMDAADPDSMATLHELKNSSDLSSLPAVTLASLCEGLVGLYLEHHFRCETRPAKIYAIGGQVVRHQPDKSQPETKHVFKIEWGDGNKKTSGPERIFFYLNLGAVNIIRDQYNAIVLD